MKNVSSLLFLILLFLFLVSSGNESTSISETETPAAETEDFNDGKTSAKDIEGDVEMMQIIFGF